MPKQVIKILSMVKERLSVLGKLDFIHSLYAATGMLVTAVILMLVVAASISNTGSKPSPEVSRQSLAISTVNTPEDPGELQPVKEDYVLPQPAPAAVIVEQSASQAVVENSAGEAVWPLQGQIKTDFGWQEYPLYGEWRFHAGVDIVGQEGVAGTVRSAFPGKVIDIYEDRHTGLTVSAAHGKDTVYYGSLAEVKVQKGELLTAGQVIGTAGTCPSEPFVHLHFAVKRGGNSVNPREFLK
ncbi:hypothetical protein P22_1572 [Propionispora sp. 2/2-37]|uniref:M23 family metallopeptidase n=1 Tax=Propionispora sp. 2/2-37 TaxID=1677858 RepID=UPI0006BB5FB7|nr:M23 family metallopeptidase [Propionispora sp. 2/2-37]CUH95501.1 hypothetical protein P22_1572 [Propionispora sp. 2/2-37]